MSKEAMKVLVKDVVSELVWENPDWAEGLKDLPKEDMMEAMMLVTEIYAEVRILATTLGSSIRKDEETVNKLIEAAMVLNPIK